MAMTVMNSAGEIAEYTTGKAPDRPELIADNTRRGIKSVPAEVKVEPSSEESKGADDDSVPEFAKKLGLSAEQHSSVTELIKREVGKKHRQAKEAEEFAASQYNTKILAEERAEKAERELTRLRTEGQTVKPTAEGVEPKRENFADDKAYFEALTDWKVDLKFKARADDEAKQRETARQEEIMSAARSRISKASEIVSDFQEVVGAVDTFVPSHIASYMQESEMLAELGYHFAKNPDDLKALAAMPSRTYADLVRVGIAIDKIESKLEPFAASVAKPKTNGIKPSSSNGAKPSDDTGLLPSQPRVAAPVIQPLNVGSGSQVDKPASRMNYAEARADFEKRNRRDFSRRSRH